MTRSGLPIGNQYTQQYTEPQKHIRKNTSFFAPIIFPRGPKKTTFWVTAASRRRLPTLGEHNTRWDGRRPLWQRLPQCSILACQRSKHTQIDKRRTIHKKLTNFSSLFPSQGDLTQPNLAHTKVIKPVGGQDAKCCVIQRNVRSTRGSCTPRHRAMYILRLRQTNHDQKVTMVHSNRRGNFVRW